MISFYKINCSKHRVKLVYWGLWYL